MKEEKYSCPNVDCGFTHYDGGDCPYCGMSLEKIRGEETPMAEDLDNDNSPVPIVNDFNDDPDMWYADEGGLETI